MSMDKLVQLYMKNIVRLHCTTVSIYSNRDARFTLEYGRNSKKQCVTSRNLITFISGHLDNLDGHT